MAWLRHMKTTAERRQYFDAIDNGYTPRAKRNPANIPNAWDDHWCSSLGDRCWKRYRLRQYK